MLARLAVGRDHGLWNGVSLPCCRGLLSCGAGAGAGAGAGGSFSFSFSFSVGLAAVSSCCSRHHPHLVSASPSCPLPRLALFYAWAAASCRGARRSCVCRHHQHHRLQRRQLTCSFGGAWGWSPRPYLDCGCGCGCGLRCWRPWTLGCLLILLFSCGGPRASCYGSDLKQHPRACCGRPCVFFAGGGAPPCRRHLTVCGAWPLPLDRLH